MDDFGLYFIITRPKLPYRVLAQACVDRDIRLLQLREKELPDRQIIAAAEEILSVTRGTETRLIMNDRADLARLVYADGLHLGQDDISLKQSHNVFSGKYKIRGLSTHSLDQARKAWSEKPDYVGFGPIFRTPTKKHPDPAVGTKRLKRITTDSPVPVVAIGGIFPENLPDVIAGGARNVCLVRHFMECASEEILVKRIEWIQARIGEGK